MSITVPSIITIPSAISYRNAAGRTTPLTNIELDQNFAFLHNETDLRLKISDYTSQTIIDKLNGDTLSASPGGIDSYKLRGLNPESSNVVTSLVMRDGEGNFEANIITANTLVGNAQTATLAADATKLAAPVNINGIPFDGSADITVYDSLAFPRTGGFLLGRLTLSQIQANEATDGVTLTLYKVARDAQGVVTITTINETGYSVGQYVTVTADESSVNVEAVPISEIVSPTKFKYQSAVTNSALAEQDDSGTCTTVSIGPFNIPVTTQTPSAPVEGDMWMEPEGQWHRIDGRSRRVAYIDSDISGTAGNVTGIVTVEHGGTNADNAQTARENLEAAKSGENNDITELAALETPITPEQGGTGLNSAGPAGNVLISDGIGWTSGQPHYPVSGMITYFAGENAPTGWLPCIGQLLLKSEYPNLYNAIGLRYTETILELQTIDFGTQMNGIEIGFGVERTPSGTGLGETGGFKTDEVEGGPYLRFGTHTKEIHGTTVSFSSMVILNNVATLAFSQQQPEPPFQAGGRILVKISSGVVDYAYYIGAWEVLECTDTYVSYVVPTYSRPVRSGTNLGTAQRSRFVTFTVNARYANRMSFSIIRGNNSNGGERPNQATDSLKLYFKDIQSGFLVEIGTLYPSTGDPTATLEERTDDYAASWKLRGLTIPYFARNDNQTFEIHQSSVGAEFSAIQVNTSGTSNPSLLNTATALEISPDAEDAAAGYVRLVGQFPTIEQGDSVILTGWFGAELWKVNGWWEIVGKETIDNVDYIYFNVGPGINITTVNIPTNVPGGNITGTVYWYTGYAGLTDAYGMKAVYFYDVQSEESEGFSFRLPDLRGEFIRGWDNGRGVDPDRPLGSLQYDGVGPHRHNLIGDLGTPFFAVSTGYGGAGEYGTTGSNVRAGSNGVMSAVTGYVDGFGAPPETRPRNIALLPCIKI